MSLDYSDRQATGHAYRAELNFCDKRPTDVVQTSVGPHLQIDRRDHNRGPEVPGLADLVRSELKE